MVSDRTPSYSENKGQLKNSEFDRTYTLWTVTEDEELLRLFLHENLTNLEISIKLRRTLGSIRARLRLHGYSNQNVATFGTQFVDYIKNGINPITGEILSGDSAWFHPKILEDLEGYIGERKSSEPEKNKKLDIETNFLVDEERPIFRELMLQIKKFLPKISDRDQKLLVFHYDYSSKKKTLQETADKFSISRERVRQIRNRSLRKLKTSIKRRNFTYLKSNFDKSKNLDNKNALLYLNSVLEKIAFHNGWNKRPQNTIQVREIELSKKNIFKLEKFDTFTIFNEHSKVTRDEFTDDVIIERRNENSKAGRLLNFGFPIIWEEVEEMQKRVDLGHNQNQLEEYFQRSHKSIYACLEKINYLPR